MSEIDRGNGRKDIPGILFVTDENLNAGRVSWGGRGREGKAYHCV
jgi:hypothetical protein